MPECEYCGKEFGNAGAKASHENACPEKPEPAPAQEQQAPRDPEAQRQTQAPSPPANQQAQQAQPPANQQQQADAHAPAPADMGSEEVLGAGMKLGSLAVGASSDDPAAKSEAAGKALQFIAGAAARAGERKIQEGREQHQRAKQNANRQTKPSGDYPECAGCGGQITQVPDHEPFSCPHCGTMLEFE